MTMEKSRAALEEPKKSYPEKFASEDAIFKHVNRGDRIFIGTACAEPQYLVQALTDYAARNPKAFFDAEVFHVWTLGVAPYTHQKFKRNFRLNSFFVGDNTREAINQGLADYSPLFLSKVPHLLHQGMIQFDIALVQTSLPDKLGYMSLGISVDIVTLWRRSTLFDCIEPHETPWQSEIRGDARLRKLGALVLGTRQAPLRYTIAIQKGKFEPGGGYQTPAHEDKGDVEYIRAQGWIPQEYL